MILKQGDCLSLMKEIKSKSIDMILCDLPYGTTKCKWDTVIPFEPLWNEYNRIIKDNGVVALFGSEPFSSRLRISNLQNYKYDIVWEKSKATGFLNAKKRPLVAHENISLFYKKQPIYNPQFSYGKSYDKGIRKAQTEDDVYGKFSQTSVKSDGARYPRSVRYYKTAESEGKTYHKTQKPVLLLEDLIKTYSNESEIILDNCMGSGSTGVACVNTSREFIGFELDDNYFKIAENRIQEAICLKQGIPMIKPEILDTSLDYSA